MGTIAQNGARGAAYAFRRPGDTWVQHSKFARTDLEEGARFGSNIALDRNSMLISASSACGGTGAVYSYGYDAATDVWQEMAQLQAPVLDEQSSFGADIAMSDGFALVGAPGFFSGGGAALIYGLAEGQWQLATLLIPFETSGGSGFGGSISFDGTTALIGARGGPSSVPRSR